MAGRMSIAEARRITDGRAGGNAAQRRRARRQTPLSDLIVAEAVSHPDNFRQAVAGLIDGNPRLEETLRGVLQYVIDHRRPRRGQGGR